MQQVLTGEHENVEDVNVNGRSLGAMMLQQVERYPTVGIDRDDLAVDERARRQVFACFGDTRELRREIGPSPRPQPHTADVVAGETAVAVELDFIQPIRAFG